MSYYVNYSKNFFKKVLNYAGIPNDDLDTKQKLAIKFNYFFSTQAKSFLFPEQIKCIAEIFGINIVNKSIKNLCIEISQQIIIYPHQIVGNILPYNLSNIVIEYSTNPRLIANKKYYKNNPLPNPLFQTYVEYEYLSSGMPYVSKRGVHPIEPIHKKFIIFIDKILEQLQIDFFTLYPRGISNDIETILNLNLTPIYIKNSKYPNARKKPLKSLKLKSKHYYLNNIVGNTSQKITATLKFYLYYTPKGRPILRVEHNEYEGKTSYYGIINYRMNYWFYLN